ncbi:FkbM family methyltransferase [Hymenobacter arizonensis]|uniref:Methyltransferase, FkbM family n=1 Tax=Hymenobacter arizonensis TaxID=1227077 RepID=A0A1I5SKE7_HYMAR|nr:FkbM family methyltransferase [Hymenobacter arizonensis]SFP71205.1 methyltransferase, FkbM family [Hymenobacter arizonensis]
MFNYLINSFRRKLARRVTQKHPTEINIFEVAGIGKIKFANWNNPLVEKKIISNDTTDFFKKFLSPGDFSIDIGANIGHTTVQMSLASGAKGLTLGFDPNPYVYEILSENAGLNPEHTRIDALNLAISEEDNEFFYNSSEASFNKGGISLESDNKHGKYALSTKVKGVNLEQFLEKEYPDYLGRLKLIKIDTEGYDKEIIRSISGLLKKYKPVVITECFGKNKPEEKYEQFELLKELGYSMYYFADFNTNAEIVPITSKEDMLKWKHFDFYAIANG